MAHLIEVAFTGNRKGFYLWEGDEPPAVRAPVIVEADRGEDLGHVHATGALAEVRCKGCAHGCGPTLPTEKALRLGTAADEARWQSLRTDAEQARRAALARVKAHQLVMKISDAEWQFDGRKLTFYFTAEKRVDFRGLVRDLAAQFRTRIELKQIGVRDEAKRLSGIGRCGREYCSASWLPDLRPVNLSVAKDQRLSLNPTQISGACGRLMCCLRYEHEFYVQQRKRFPKEGKVLATRSGDVRVLANDIFNERVTVRTVEGDTRVVPLAELRRELDLLGEFLGGVATEPDAHAAGPADEGEGDEFVADGAPTWRAPATPPRAAMPIAPAGAVTPSAPPAPPRGPSPAAPPRPTAPVESAAPGTPAGPDARTAPLAEALDIDGADEESDEGDDESPNPTAAAGGDAPRPRRRRGRRGGRRGRGGSGGDRSGGAPPGAGPSGDGPAGPPSSSPPRSPL